ncbi:hypothetical protein ACF1BQ_000755 [Bradyrhizobium sp. RDT10]
MMRMRLAAVDASKPGKLSALHAKPEVRQKPSEGVDGFDLALEDEFGAWENTDCHSRLAHRSEATRFCPGKFG